MKLIALTAALVLMAGTAMAKQATANIKLPRMDCASCAVVVKQALMKTTGVKETSIDVDKRVVTVVYEDSQVTLPQLHQTIEKTGFEVEASAKGR